MDEVREKEVEMEGERIGGEGGGGGGGEGGEAGGDVKVGSCGSGRNGEMRVEEEEEVEVVE